MLPRGIPHSFSVTGDRQARMLQLSSPAQFEHFAAEMGEPATEMVIPEPREVDVPKLLGVAPKYGIQMLPPPGERSSRCLSRPFVLRLDAKDGSIQRDQGQPPSRDLDVGVVG